MRRRKLQFCLASAASLFRRIDLSKAGRKWIGGVSGVLILLAAAPVRMAGQTSVDVTLHPSSEVADGSPQVISFGLPLQPGLLQDPALIRVRTQDGSEIAAWTRSLGPWRSLPPEKLRCGGGASAEGSLRSVLIQFELPFYGTDAVRVSIDVGTARTMNRDAEVPARSLLRVAKEGTYEEADGIMEPRVYATLPPEWLVCARLVPLSSVADRHQFLQKFDAGMKNFLPAILNTFSNAPSPSSLVPYKTDPEPWLYDRAQVLYNVYLRTGAVEVLREAHRAAWHYMKNVYRPGDCPGLEDVACMGFFRLTDRSNDPYKDSKYAYNESLGTLYWLTGIEETLPYFGYARSATQRQVPFHIPYTDPSRFFTERHYANALLSPLIEYEVTGNEDARKWAQQGVEMLYHMQNNPIEGAEKNGCFNYHVESNARLSFSPWMSSLMAYSLLRAYQTLGDSRIPGMLTDLSACIAQRGLYFPASTREPQFWIPRYIATSTGESASLDGSPYSDREHAADVAFLMALGSYFSENNEQKGRFTSLTASLLRTHDEVLNVATRPAGYPANGAALYQVTPPRKYSWWYKNSPAIGEVAGNGTSDVAGPDLIPPIVGGGVTTTQNEVVLAGPAGHDGQIVRLQSSNPDLAEVPSEVTVPAGKISASFPIKTKYVSARTVAHIDAITGDRTRSSDLAITPPLADAVLLGSTRLGVGVVTTNNRIQLNAPAPTGGLAVQLTAEPADLVRIPDVVQVSEGATAANFTVQALDTDRTRTVTIAATTDGVRAANRLNVEPLQLLSLVLTPSVLGGGAVSTANRINLNGAAPEGGLVVELSSSHPDFAQVPSTVTIPPGGTFATFPITTLSSSSAVAAVITAKGNRNSVTGRLTIGPIKLVSITPASANVLGGNGRDYSINLSGPAGAEGVTVLLESMNSAIAEVPTEVRIGEGQTSALFPVRTMPVPTRTSVQLKATLGGTVATATINVLPPALSYLRLAPTSVTGGATTANNAIAITGKAPEGGVVIEFSSSDPQVARVPMSVVVPSSASLATFSIETSQVAQATPVTIKASYLGIERTATLTVRP